jgi:hypothetical protein
MGSRLEAGQIGARYTTRLFWRECDTSRQTKALFPDETSTAA